MSNKLYNIDNDVYVEAYGEMINIYSLDNKVDIDVHVLNVEKLISALKQVSVEIKSNNSALQLTHKPKSSIEERVLKARKLYNSLVFGRDEEKPVKAKNFMPLKDEIMLDSLGEL